MGFRNLKDAFVSFYHHMDLIDDRVEKPSWAEYFHSFMYSKTGIVSLYLHIILSTCNRYNSMYKRTTKIANILR